ncbi:hypothetical protein GF339_16130 [candidate division KSB3 bacterium]|uniref:Citrate transporter-like domain-containing protein n=1 Tax=candidate division KSB3 bacterium TaxID=2044937 RepID=A0A9D5Q6T0_9BACT|nr:hypothetical protein [candidate division KSB3 bacterium]MBD3326115.1 hypothetical protein [candidate division KSB3 bacterium]
MTNIDKIQLICIFVNSFLLSRLIIVTKLPERLVLYLVGTKHLPLMQIVLYMLMTAAFLSFFIPNVITVLTLLPLIKILCSTFEMSLPTKYRAIATLFPLTVIYGANIGGMGSITGTPANGIMVAYATLSQLPGIEYLTFAYWLLWGIPVVMVLVLTAWTVLTVSFRLWNYHSDLVQIAFPQYHAFHPLQPVAIKLTLGFFLSFIFFSILMKISSAKLLILLLTAASTLLLLAFLFLIPLHPPGHVPPRRLLTLRDCYSHLPWRGLVVVGIILVIIGIGALLNLQDHIVRLFGTIFQQAKPTVSFYLALAVLTSFATELLSNTVVQFAMFTVVLPLLETTDLTAFQAFLIITLSCTCAFMSPIATGVNGLAFGEIKGISVFKMLVTGLVMKLLGIGVIAFGVPVLLQWIF